MKTTQFFTRTVAAMMLMATCSMTANAQFGNLGDKLKNTAKNKANGVVSTVENKAKNSVKDVSDKAMQKAKQKAYKTITKKVLGVKEMPELPWTMAETTFVDLNNAKREGMTNAYTWLMNCGDISNDDMIALRKQMEARYAANNKILLAEQAGVISALGEAGYYILNEVKEEQNRYWQFYGAIKNSLNIHASGITCNPDHTTTVNLKNAGLVCSRNGGGFGYILGVTDKDKGCFLDLAGRGAYLEDDELEEAKYTARRVLNYGFLLEGVDGTQDDKASLENILDKEVFGKTGFDTDWAFETNRAAMYAKLLAEACAANSPENIERLPMPKAGAMNKSLKAKALALAKADDSSVVDVVITSKSWNIQRNVLGIPTHRTVTGYWIKNTKHGKQAVSRSWCQDHEGGGRYGSLRNYGIGVSSPFYLK